MRADGTALFVARRARADAERPLPCEYGGPVAIHSNDTRFWMPRSCDLTATGVAERIAQYRADVALDPLPTGAVTVAEHIEAAIQTLMRVERENAIDCTGPGEVGCKGRTGWHSWADHRLHVAADQVAALADAGLISSPPAGGDDRG